MSSEICLNCRAITNTYDKVRNFCDWCDSEAWNKLFDMQGNPRKTSVLECAEPKSEEKGARES